jgi:5-methyltetrahydropteroyltriglutamate--homocysteine methyltransferase
VAGGYDQIASQIFMQVKAERLLLEYDDARSGSFEALAKVPEDKIAVLGLVTTKSSRRETVDELRSRILQASKFCPLDRLAISPQCGFATSIEGNALSIDDERVKLETLVRTAELVWPWTT